MALTQVGPGMIIASQTVDTASNNGTGAIQMPIGTTAQRPSSPSLGMTRFNSSLNGIETWNGSIWQGIGIQDGSSFENAATSADAIKALTGTTTNGFYWIINSGTPTQVWCDMTNNGGGWMMIARLHTDNSYWTYNDGIWTNSSSLNPTGAFDYVGHVKHPFYYSRPHSQVRVCMGSIANAIVESTWSNTSNFATFMNSGSTNSSNSRATWDTWRNTALGTSLSWLANCNQIGTNKAYNYQYVKLGATINGENDCNTCDECFGFGLQGISPYSETISSGAYSPYNGTGSANVVGWIFIK